MSVMDDENSGAAAMRLSGEDIRVRLESMSSAEMLRFEAIVRHFAPRSGMSADDLRQETIARALGDRTCAAGTPFLGFLAGVVRSIASEAPRARRAAQAGSGLQLSYIADYGATDGAEPADEAPSPEDAALARVIYARELERVALVLEDDETLQLLAEGLGEGLRGKDLEDLLVTDTSGLAAAKRRLTRRLLASFGEGAPL
jgi:DNA-directed RNA polymerase specialized sigma24 family protein